MEGSGSGQMSGTIQSFSLSYWVKPQNTSAIIADLWAKIWTWELPNMKLEC